MTQHTEAQEQKARCLEDIRAVIQRYEDRLRRIDERVWEYAKDLVREDIDIHNTDELLGFRKFLRLLDTYTFDYNLVHNVLYDAEGEWRCTDGVWRHVRGGLTIDGIFGYRVYRQTTLQVFAYAWIYGFYKWTDTTSIVGSREMMETERTGARLNEKGKSPDGNYYIPDHIYDFRRLVHTFILLWPRKMAKTFTSSFIGYQELMFGERDAQIYIASNSTEQSKVLWGMCDKFVTQKDGWRKYFRRSDNDQHRFLRFKPENDTGRVAELVALSANAKTKDGLKASVILADEFGAAQRSRGNASDMEKLVGVLEGSQGPIRDPLTVHSSTAGTGVDTAYEGIINSTHRMNVDELKIPLDGKPHPTPNDWQGCILLRPDEWERGDDMLLQTERVIRKVNPNVGVTIQPDYYANEWARAATDGEIKRKEVVTKLYNIFCTDRAVDWITGDEIRYLMFSLDENYPEIGYAPQEDWPRRIEDCKAGDGWIVLTGMDFTNVGDDLQAATYVAARRRPTGSMQFFVQFEAWVTMEAVWKNPYKNLLLQWADEGYLHIANKKTISTSMVFDRIVSLRNEHGCNMLGFGYDPFKAKEIVNDLRVWIAGFGVKPDKLGDYIMPVSQTYGAVNPVLEEVTALIRDENTMIRFAYSPLVPWEFSNCRLAESADGMENKKIVKANPDSPGKIDNVQSMLNAFYVYDQMRFKIQK